VRHRPELRVIEANICSTELVERIRRSERIDTVVHFAADSHVDRSIQGPDAFIETNVLGTYST
jgi:dTDP-glucose 4,6-dehydratase